MVTTLWSIADRSHPVRVAELLRHPGADPQITTFARDLRTMAVSSKGSTQLWDISDPGKPRKLGAPITAKTPRLESAQFTPDSKTLLIRGFDGVLRLWDITDRSRPTELATLTPTGGYSDNSGISVADHQLAAITAEGTFSLWDLDPQHAVDRICAVTGSFWTEELWQRYLPNLPYHRPCQGN